MEKGLIHIYSGDGVGKTTAATGLAVRAAGNGKKVVFAQFMKGSPSGEISVLKRVKNITVFRNDIDFGFSNHFTEEIKKEITGKHNQTLAEIFELLENEQIDLLILDEINSAYALNLIDKDRVDALVFRKPQKLELVLTGRNPREEFVKAADYVSDIKCVKHPFYKGIPARKGIEY